MGIISENPGLVLVISGLCLMAISFVFDSFAMSAIGDILAEAPQGPISYPVFFLGLVCFFGGLYLLKRD